MRFEHFQLLHNPNLEIYEWLDDNNITWTSDWLDGHEMPYLDIPDDTEARSFQLRFRSVENYN